MEKYFKQTSEGLPYNAKEKYKYETVRLTTFTSWPPKHKVRPLNLAKMGFYCEGDEVKCFSCDAYVRNWINKSGLEEAHRQVKYNCPMLMGTDRENVPLLPPAMNKREADEGLPIIPIPTEGIPGDIIFSHVARRQPDNQVDRSFLKEHYPERVVAKFGVLNWSWGTVLNTEPTHQHKAMKMELTFGRKGAKTSEHPTGQLFMELEEDRMKTFSSWPARERVDPVELVKAGFYYLGVSDRVKCAYCHNVLQKWVLGDVPLEEHKKYFPSCPFVQGFSTGMIDTEEVELQNVTKRKDVDGTMGKKTGTQTKVKYKGENSAMNLRNGHGQRCLEVPIQPPQQQQGLPEPEEVLAGAPEVHSLHIQDHTGGVALIRGADNAGRIGDEEEHAGHSPGENPSGAAVDSRGRFVDQVQDNHRQLRHQQQQQQKPQQREGWHQKPQQLPQQEQRQRSLRRRQQQQRRQQQHLSSNGIQAEDELLCRVCRDREACMIFLPCGHRSSCWECSQQMPHVCPICRSWAHSRLRGKRDMDDPDKYMRYSW